MVHVKSGVNLKNVTPHNNILLYSYFETPTFGLRDQYVLNMLVNFHANQVHYFKLQKCEFRQLIEDIPLNL